MRWWAAAVLTSALLILGAAPALACDPDWDWCGYDWYDTWYDPYWYEAPVYEEPLPVWIWWDEPAYEPPAVSDQPVSYEPAYAPLPVYEPPPLYQPAPVYEPAPVYVAPTVADTPSYAWVPEPVAIADVPAWSDPFVWSSPGSDVLDASTPPAPQPVPTAAQAAPDPDAQRAALGLHRVTDVHAGDTVTTEGLVTTYSSNTVAMDAGTSAALIASIGTGEASAYDGLLWNGRMALSDGRPVKGEIYANYLWNGYDWVFDKYVFFQDDLEIARISTPAATPMVPTGGLPVPAPTSAPTSAVATVPVVPATAQIGAPAFVTPLTGDVPAPSTPSPSSPPAPGGSQPVGRELRAGIALAPQADPLGRVEVLRGRRVPLWVRATLGGAPARVLGWRLVSGELTALGPISGTGDDPLVATWRSISAPGAAFTVRLRASVDVPAEGTREIDATIDVVVRSPALVE